MFVIPCRFDPSNPVVFECIQAIQKYHDNPHILVVDSNSEDATYLDWCRDRGCEVASISNTGYAHGAFAWAVRNSNEPFYYFMFDSLIPTANLDSFQDRPLTVLRHWSNTQHDWGWDVNGTHLSIWGGRQLDSMGIPMPSSYHGIMGPIMFVQRSVVDELEAIGYYDIQIPSSYEHCGLERVAGITLEHIGYDIPSVSIQGTHISHWSDYPEDMVRKVNMSRA